MVFQNFEAYNYSYLIDGLYHSYLLIVFVARIVYSENVSVELPRPPDKSAYRKISFFISHPKHMLWILKRTVSMRRFF